MERADRLLTPELDALDEDEREPREHPDAGIMCRFCAKAGDECECVIEVQVRCGRCLGPVFTLQNAGGSVRYGCLTHGAGVRTRTVNIHYPKDWGPRLDDVQYEDRLFAD